jgi:uncharacterized protein YjbI with pentapeptide repeats
LEVFPVANPHHLAILERGVEAWNKWREENPGVMPNLKRANLMGVTLPKADLKGVDLFRADLTGTDLSGANLARAQLSDAKFTRAKMRGANLEEANLMGADLTETDLRKANLTRANLAAATLMNVFLTGADLTMVDLVGTIVVRSFFTRANLTKANLTGALFSGTTFRDANFTAAKLPKVNLSGAVLVNAKLTDALLWGTNLAGADLRSTIITKADLSEADLRGADLSRADLSNSIIATDYFDNKMKCRGIKVHGCVGSQRFIRHVNDLDYIAETKEKHPLKYYIWKCTSDCGRSIGRWALISFILSALFGIVFAGYPVWPWLPKGVKTFLISIAPIFSYSNPSIQDGWFTPYYFSIVTFTTLGFGDVTPSNTAGQLWLSTEVALGYIMLGGLVTLFATKMVRPSS